MLYKSTLLITSAAIFFGLNPSHSRLTASLFFAIGFIFCEYLIFEEEEEEEYEPVDKEEYTPQEILLPVFKYL